MHRKNKRSFGCASRPNRLVPKAFSGRRRSSLDTKCSGATTGWMMHCCVQRIATNCWPQRLRFGQTRPMIINDPIVPVILSGGSGTRLWPVSRESFPKQLWPLISDRTLLQETVLRGNTPGFAAPIVVCNHEHRFLIAEQLREVGITNARVVLEPVGRNSAPAIAAAA